MSSHEKQAVVKQEMRITLQLLETQVAAIHQVGLFDSSMRSVQNICDNVKISSMVIAGRGPALDQYDSSGLAYATGLVSDPFLP